MANLRVLLLEGCDLVITRDQACVENQNVKWLCRQGRKYQYLFEGLHRDDAVVAQLVEHFSMDSRGRCCASAIRMVSALFGMVNP